MDNQNIDDTGLTNIAAEQEAMLPQSKVNELIGSAKASAYEKARRELEAQYAQQTAAAQPKTMGGMTQPSVEEMYAELEARQLARQQEEYQRAQQEEYQMQVANVAKTYLDKMSKGKELYEDFETITQDFNPAEFKEIVFLASELDDTAGVIYELSKNPHKLSDVLTLAMRSPNLARKQLKSLESSIKMNREAIANNRQAAQPLSALKPSITASADSGQRTLRDFKRMFKG